MYMAVTCVAAPRAKVPHSIAVLFVIPSSASTPGRVSMSYQTRSTCEHSLTKLDSFLFLVSRNILQRVRPYTCDAEYNYLTSPTSGLSRLRTARMDAKCQDTLRGEPLCKSERKQGIGSLCLRISLAPLIFSSVLEVDIVEIDVGPRVHLARDGDHARGVFWRCSSPETGENKVREEEVREVVAVELGFDTVNGLVGAWEGYSSIIDENLGFTSNLVLAADR